MLALAAALLLAAPGDTQPLTLACPPLAKIVCGMDTSPDSLGLPTVSGGCGNVDVSYRDFFRPAKCAAARFDETIIRVWTAVDECGTEISCTQFVHVLKKPVFFDIKPTSCPNPLQVGGGGVLPTAILGTAAFDVNQIVPESIELWAVGCRAGPVLPTRVNLEDVAEPFMGTGCDCHTLGPDGFTDLTIKFDKAEVAAITAANPAGGRTRLIITGMLTDGCAFVGSDCVRPQ